MLPINTHLPPGILPIIPAPAMADSSLNSSSSSTENSTIYTSPNPMVVDKRSFGNKPPCDANYRSLFLEGNLTQEFLFTHKLLYQAPEFQTNYSTIPKGQIDFSDGTIRFANTVNQDQWKKKTLIVSNPLLESGKISDDSFQFERFLGFMMQQGFPVVINTSEGLKKVNKEIDLNDYLKNSTITDSLKLVDAATSTGLEKMQFLEINFGNVREFLAPFKSLLKPSSSSYFQLVDSFKISSSYDLWSSFIGCKTYFRALENHQSFTGPLFLEINTLFDAQDQIILALTQLPSETTLCLSCSISDVEYYLDYVKPDSLKALMVNIYLDTNRYEIFSLSLKALENCHYLEMVMINCPISFDINDSDSLFLHLNNPNVHTALPLFLNHREIFNKNAANNGMSTKCLLSSSFSTTLIDEIQKIEITHEKINLYSRNASGQFEEHVVHGRKKVDLPPPFDITSPSVTSISSIETLRALANTPLSHVKITSGKLVKTLSESEMDEVITLILSLLKTSQHTLKELELIGFYELVPESFDFDFQLSQLQKFICIDARLTSNHFINLITLIPNANSLTIQLEEFILSENSPKHPKLTRLPHLRYLDISIGSEHDPVNHESEFVIKRLLQNKKIEELHLVGLSTKYLRQVTLNNLLVATLPYYEGIEISFPNLKHLFFDEPYLAPLENLDNICTYYTDRSTTLVEHNTQFKHPYATGQGTGFSYMEEAPLGTLNAQQIFEHTHPREHREQLIEVSWIDGVMHHKKIEGTIEIVDIRDLLWPPYTVEDGECFQDKGYFNHIVTHKTWIPLIGLTANERLTSLKYLDVRNPQGVVCDALLEWGYNSSTHQCYVRAQEGVIVNVVLAYELSYVTHPLPEVPFEGESSGIKFSKNTLYISKDWELDDPYQLIAKLISLFKRFTPGKVERDPSALDEEGINEECALINACLEKLMGAACGGKSEIFCIIIGLLLPEAKVSMCKNGFHAWVEIWYRGQFFKGDLGGYPVSVEMTPFSAVPLFSELIIPSTPPLAQTLNNASKGFSDDLSTSYQEYTDNLIQLMRDPTSDSKQALLLLTREQFPLIIKNTIESAIRNNVAIEYMDIKERSLYELNNNSDEGAFLTSNQACDILVNGGVLILDLIHLSPSNIAALCQATDPAQRILNGIELHSNTSVILLLPSEFPISKDVIRRCDMIRTVPQFAESFNLSNRFIDASSSPSPHATPIALYNDSTGWKNALTNTISPHLDILPGALVQAIVENRAVVILDAPKNNAFYAFLNQLERGKIRFNGSDIDIPENFKIYFGSMPHPTSVLEVSRTVDEADLVLNQQTFYQFFPSWIVTETGYDKTAGHLEKFPGQKISLYVSDNLNKYHWSKLIYEADKYNVSLSLICPKAVTLPSDLNLHEKSGQPSHFRSNLYLTDDVHTYVQQLKNLMVDAVVLHISSQVTLADLMPSIHERDGAFELVEGELWETLKQGKPCILTGSLSTVLMQELAPLFVQKHPSMMVNGTHYYLPATLCVVTSDRSLVNNLPFQEVETSSFDPTCQIPQARRDYLESLLQKQKVIPNHQNIKQLNRFLDAHVEGVDSLFSTDGDFAPEPPDRIAYVLRLLDLTPLIYIHGRPASGKTHFITHELPAFLPDHIFYYSYSKIQNFLEDENAAILCIDEGDISPEMTQLLEGFLLEEPTVYFNHKIYTDNDLKAKKVIFLGNAHHCGRKKLGFIENHGGAIGFKPLPLWMIKEQVLKPLLDPVIAETFASRVIELYQEIKKVDENIDLRSLQTVCALSHVYRLGARLMPYNLAEYCFLDLFPDTPSLFLHKKFHQHFISQEVDLWIKEHQWTSEYTLTSSRKDILWKLITHQRTQQLNIKGAQKGIIIEGLAGEGKSALIKSFVKASNTPYICIDLTRDVTEVKKLLKDSFHAGLTIIVEEFDGFYEEDFNAFLTGTDLEGNPAENPGMNLIASKNKGYNWRLPIKPALLSRLREKIVMPMYTVAESRMILKGFNLDDESVERLIKDHEQETTQATHELLKPTSASLFAKAKRLAAAKPKRDCDSEAITSKRVCQ